MPTLLAFGDQLLQGASLTILIAAASMLAGCLVGLVGAAMKLSGRQPLVGIAEAYTTVIRGLPDLLVIFIFYFGGMTALGKLFGHYVDVDPFAAGACALAIIFGAYATEIFRGAIIAVPKGQREGAQSLGLSKAVMFMLVVLPQAARHALPALGNLSIVLLKETSLVSVIGLEELMRKSSLAAGATKEPFTFYAAAAVLYLCMTGTMTLALHAAERRARRGAREA